MLEPLLKTSCAEFGSYEEDTQTAGQAEAAAAAASSGYNAAGTATAKPDKNDEKKGDGLGNFAAMAKLQREQMEVVQELMQQSLFQQQQMMSAWMDSMRNMFPQPQAQGIPTAHVVQQPLATALELDPAPTHQVGEAIRAPAEHRQASRRITGRRISRQSLT